MNEFNQDSPQRPPMPPYPPHYQVKQGGSKWWIPIVIVIGSIGLFLLTIIGVVAFIGSQLSEISFSSSGRPSLELKENSILYLELGDGVPEKNEENPFAQIFGGKLKSNSFFNTLLAIEKAKDDERITGIYIKPSSSIPYNRALEINKALKEFKESGKFIYSFIEVGNESTYISALAADSIFMPNEGMLELNGFAITNPFFKTMFSKVGVEFLTIQFEDYKSAGEQFSRDSYSDSAKHELRLLLQDRYNSFVSEIENFRNIPKTQIYEALNEGLYTTKPILERGFIDVLMSEQDVRRFIHKKVGYDVSEDKKSSKSKKKMSDDDLRLVSVGRYLTSSFELPKNIDEENQIGIVYASGSISSGEPDKSPFSSSGDGIYAKTFINHLKQAREDDDVKVIVLRIDSPGGSAIASDEMWEEIRLTTKVKPVIASMSSVAASGGYYMAMACDKIIAHPQTITGSIGVILSVPNFSGTAEKIGLKFDTITTGPAADFMTGVYPYSNKDVAKLREIAGGIYESFVSKAAESRGFTYEEMRAKAKGRVYTGEEAFKLGLVDYLGGMEETIKLAKKEMGVDEDTKVYIKEFPKKGDAFKEFLESLMGGDFDTKLSLDIIAKFGLSQSEFKLFADNLPENVKLQFDYLLKLLDLSKREKVLLASPTLPIIE